jgi:hypothetical protein
VTLEQLLTQFAHHAHDNSPPGFQAGARGAAASPTDSADSGSDDLGGDGYGGGAGGGESDDEGCSPGGAHGYGGMGAAYGMYGAAAAAAPYCYAPGFATAPLAHPHLHQLRLAPCSSLGGAASGSAATLTAFHGSGAAFGGEEDDGDTFDTLNFMGTPAGGSRATGAQYDSEEAGAAGSIESLLEDFASAGAAAAAAALGGGGATLGAAGAGDALAWTPGGGGAAAKRDHLALGGADGAGSPLKRLRREDGGDAALDELAICYADQRGSSAGPAAPACGGAAVVREAPADAAAAAQGKEQQQRGAALPPVEPPAGACEWAGAAATPSALVGCGGSGLELLDALPPSIRSCLVDAAALYLANDATGLAA